jgi:hypothetical protein
MDLLLRDSAKHAECHTAVPRHVPGYDCTRALDAAALKVATPYTSTKNPYSDVPTTSQDILARACMLTRTMRTVFAALLTSFAHSPSLQH